MKIERITSPGLAHHSYFLADRGEALVVDPRRDVDVYLDLARESGARIQAVVETHRNEDYVIGSTALADATGARVLHGTGLDFGYGEALGDGDELACGRLRLRAIETPGHTPEHLALALADTRTGDEVVAAFTGDALFVGDTGRIDLWRTPEEAAEALHASLLERILPLGDHVALLPAHGGGSVCGGSILDRELSTLGFERRTNPLLRGDRAAFVRAKTSEKHVRPPYFRRMEAWNGQGTAPIHARLPVPPPLSPGELADALEEGVRLVDLRMPQAFAGGHVPGACNVWLEGVSGYLGWAVPPGARFALVLPEDADPAAVARVLLRIGYDECVGWLRGGFESWQDEGRELGRLGTIDTAELRRRIGCDDGLLVLDVRTPAEWEEGGGVEGAERIFVGELEERLAEVPRDALVVTTCSVGHRGGLAASLLARHGYERVLNHLGGAEAWEATEAGARRPVRA